MKRNDLVSTGLLTNALRRFWPLWLAGFVGFALCFDLPFYGFATSVVRTMSSAELRAEEIGTFWITMRFVGWAYALVGSIVVSLVLSGHLFDGRSATFVGSLPVRRPTAFASFALVGLAVLLAIPAAAALLLLPLRLTLGEVVAIDAIAGWYGMTAVFVLAFFAIAQLSCQLAGTAAVALLFYLVINFLVVCLEAAAGVMVTALLYGINTHYVGWLVWFSPAARLLEAAIRWDEGFRSDRIALACGVALAVATLALASHLYRRRDLERAGDSVAWPSIRPVLKYLAGISMALLFGSLYRMAHLDTFSYGLPETPAGVVAMACLAAVGGFLGVLFAEMIMSRSAHVLARCWRGAVALAVASLCLTGACWADPLGVTRYVPEAGEVEKVELLQGRLGTLTLTSAEGIASACDLHRDVIAYGGAGDSSNPVFTIDFTYTLRDGRTVQRAYPVLWTPDGKIMDMTASDTGDELVLRLAEIADSPEGRASRFARVLDADLSELSFMLEHALGDEEGNYATMELSLSERQDLVAGPLRTDLLEGLAGQPFTEGVWTDSTYYATLSVNRPLEGNGYEYVFSVQLSDDRTPETVAWLREHHPEIELVR